jgi:TRAP transporter 4TM/12TM fusion protein
MTQVARRIGDLLFLSLSIAALYSAAVGQFDPTYHRSLAVAVALTGLMLLRWVRTPTGALQVAIDLAMIAVLAWATWLFIERTNAAVTLFVTYSTVDLVAGLLAVGIIVELTRRQFGPSLAVLALVAVAYCFVGPWLPGLLGHGGFSLSQTMEFIWYGFQGVFGLPMSVVIDTILIFIVFGVVLGGTGAADALIRISFALTARLRGGPAHAAIISSSIFGTMSGSVTANVVGTGSFTIPMIRRRGFTATYAGALEAAASTGGQIMPPVMGAAAFVMADLTGLSYVQICLAALTPALLFYLSLFLSVGFEVGRRDIGEAETAEAAIPLHRGDIVASLGFLVPIAVVVAILFVGLSPATAGFWATVAAIALGPIYPEFRRNPLRLTGLLRDAGIASAGIILAVAVIGVVLGVLNLTGVGITFASLVGSFAGDNLLVGLILTALACLVLGMGMPTVPAYLIIVLVLGPTLKQLGAETLTLHLFVLYFGVMSALTPPVALAAFAAAPIAGVGPLGLAVKAMGLSLVGFAVPFAFVFNPELLLTEGVSLGPWAWGVLRMGVATWMLASAVAAWDGRRLARADRAVGVVLAVALLVPVLAVSGAAMVLALGLIGWRRTSAARGGETTMTKPEGGLSK